MNTKQTLGIIGTLGLFGAFFSYLGAAPGMEDMFRALMMIVTLSVAILAFRALIAIKASRKSERCLTSNRQFHDIRISEVCK